MPSKLRRYLVLSLVVLLASFVLLCQPSLRCLLHPVRLLAILTGRASPISAADESALVIEVEVHTAFDRVSPVQLESVLSDAAPRRSGAPTDSPVVLRYEVLAAERQMAVQTSGIWIVPEAVSFPLGDSVFSRVVLRVDDVSKSGDVVVDVDGEKVRLGPGEQARVGVQVKAGHPAAAYSCPEAWNPVVQDALLEERPVAVWVMRNSGWVNRQEVLTCDDS